MTWHRITPLNVRRPVAGEEPRPPGSPLPIRWSPRPLRATARHLTRRTP